MNSPAGADNAASVVLLPDAGPLITLSYADALDVLLLPGWTVQLVDMVLHEVTRRPTPTSQRLAQWVEQKQFAILATRIFQHHLDVLAAAQPLLRTANLGELAVQEVMNGFAMNSPPTRGIFLFEDHKIARSGFVLPDGCQKVSTRAFLIFLEAHGYIPSATAIHARALHAGRAFSQLRFPPE